MSGPGDPETGPKGPTPEPIPADSAETGMPDDVKSALDALIQGHDASDQPQGDSGIVTDLSHQTPWEVAMQLMADGKFEEAGNVLGMNGEQLQSLIGAAQKIGDQETLDPADEALIIHELTQYNDSDHPLTQEQVRGLLEEYHPQLDPNTKERIVNRLRPMKDEDKAKEHEITENDPTHMSGDAVMKGIENITTEIDRQLVDPESNLSDEDKKRLRNLKARSAGLYEKVGDLFRPGEPGRDWARRIGKTGYWIIMITFILLVAELNMIHNMAKGGRGGRH